jgi:hypothetical protein
MTFMMLQVVSVCLVAVAAALPLAHALELPGKMRLDKHDYLATQPIYYPGFTMAGGIGEAGGVIATSILLALTPRASREFPWTLAALLLLVAMHAAYWIFTHPLNKFWLRDRELQGLGRRFIRFAPGNRGASDTDRDDDWQRLRNQWERSHVVRAVLAETAFVCLVIAVAV